MRDPAPVPAAQLRHARFQLVEHGVIPRDDISPGVARSWQRSLCAGLSPIGRIDCTDNLNSLQLQRIRGCNHELMSQSEPIMEYLFEQLHNSHNMVILSDSQGVLLHTLGDLNFHNKADRVALKCGATWAENQRGTNAIGTALTDKRLIEVHGAEHYLDRNGFLTCAAAPIFSATGKILGALDISGDHRNRHPHTLGLVATATQMIENSMVLSSCKHQHIVQLHPRPEGIGSVAQGILAFSEEGLLVGANKRGLMLMCLQFSDVGLTHWTHIFDNHFYQFLQEKKSGFISQWLCTQQGTRLFAQMRSNGRVSGTVSVNTAHTQPDPAASPHAAGHCDEKVQQSCQRAYKVIDKSIPILITGESGVGKEWFAQSIHQHSLRRDKPFVAVNCAAIPEHLLESELFGYVAGAFTGAARQGAHGRLRDAHEGTLFLDEIGDMPVAAQTRLLRVLQERKVTPLGSGVATEVNFNLICATHQNLKKAIEQGRFRADLYYRINGLSVQLPALRERSDFARICQNMLHSLAPQLSLQLAPALHQAFQRYSWPGNLRQLYHVLRTAVALLEDHEYEITWSHLADDLANELENLAPPSHHSDSCPAQNLLEISQRAIQHALENARGNVSAAARQLGISRQTLYRKLQTS